MYFICTKCQPVHSTRSSKLNFCIVVCVVIRMPIYFAYHHYYITVNLSLMLVEKKNICCINVKIIRMLTHFSLDVHCIQKFGILSI